MGEWQRGLAGWVAEIAGPPVMGQKTVEPERYIQFSLEAAVPPDHLVRQLASCVDFGFIRQAGPAAPQSHWAAGGGPGGAVRAGSAGLPVQHSERAPTL